MDRVELEDGAILELVEDFEGHWEEEGVETEELELISKWAQGNYRQYDSRIATIIYEEL